MHRVFFSRVTCVAARDGPVEANLEPQAIVYGLFRLPAGAGQGEGGGATGPDVTGGEGKDAPAPAAPLVSFGFFGESIQ